MLTKQFLRIRENGVISFSCPTSVEIVILGSNLISKSEIRIFKGKQVQREGSTRDPTPLVNSGPKVIPVLFHPSIYCQTTCATPCPGIYGFTNLPRWNQGLDPGNLKRKSEFWPVFTGALHHDEADSAWLVVYNQNGIENSLSTMSYGKRSATSPRDNMAKKGSGQNHETALDLLVKIELETINGKQYLGQVSDDELIYIWVRVFNRSKDELYGTISTKSLTRNVRATFKLINPIKLSEISETDHFEYEKFLDDGGSEIITGRIIGHGTVKPVELGELTKITVKTNFGVEATGVLNWLKLFGTPTSQFDFKINPNTGLRTDIFETEIVLKSHVDEYLPMYGQKAQVFYPGIPRMCNRCYNVGHLRRDCNNKQLDWIVHVIDLVENHGIKTELIGSWKNAIARWKNANSTPNE